VLEQHEGVALSSPIRIGLVSLDTSHVVAFSQILNDPSNPGYVAGAKITVAFPGGSADMENSHTRVPGYTQTLRDQYGVSIVDSPAAVAEACDLVFLESIDGRVHLAQLKEVLPFKRPVFVDKPMATKTTEAREMFHLADAAGVPLMSASSLRYADPLVAALADNTDGEIIGCDACGPMAILAEPPGFFWYGIHAAEVVFAVMGAGCKSVRVASSDLTDVLHAEWADGRVATLRGLRKAHNNFGVTIHRSKGLQQANLSKAARPYYSGLLEAILRSLPHGKSDIPADQTVEIIRFLEAANESRETGKPVTL
jgi:hypothetical protein